MQIAQNGIEYLNRMIKEDYDYLVRKKADLNKQQISSLQIQYLYALSYFPDIPKEGQYLKAMTYYHKQAAIILAETKRPVAGHDRTGIIPEQGWKNFQGDHQFIKRKIHPQ